MNTNQLRWKPLSCLMVTLAVNSQRFSRALYLRTCSECESNPETDQVPTLVVLFSNQQRF